MKIKSSSATGLLKDSLKLGVKIGVAGLLSARNRKRPRRIIDICLLHSWPSRTSLLKNVSFHDITATRENFLWSQLVQASTNGPTDDAQLPVGAKINTGQSPRGVDNIWKREIKYKWYPFNLQETKPCTHEECLKSDNIDFLILNNEGHLTAVVPFMLAFYFSIKLKVKMKHQSSLRWFSLTRPWNYS